MPVFRLWESKNKAMPDAVYVDGVAFFINPSFRNVLRILSMLDDAEIDVYIKFELLAKWFFIDKTPPAPLDAYKAFMGANKVEYYDPVGAEESEDQEKTWDHDFDADEIYASFLQQYGIDLFDADMHWYKFLTLLKGLTEDTPFVSKVRLRKLDLSHYKGKDLHKMTRLKESVQLPIKYTAEEIAEMEEFKEMWG